MKTSMINKYLILLLLTGLPSGALVAEGVNIDLGSNTVIVITANSFPLQQVNRAQKVLKHMGKSLEIHNLDAVRVFEQKFSDGLPNDEAQAKVAFEQRLKKMGKAYFKAQLLQAYQGLLLASQYSIDRYPAIIFDGRFVIYGMTDLKRAIEHYQEWRDTKSLFLGENNRGAGDE